VTDAAPRSLSDDTPLEVERRWIAGLRDKGPAWRMERMMAWSATVLRMAEAAFDRVHPDATPRQRRDWILRTRYGDDVADRYAALRWRENEDGHR